MERSRLYAGTRAARIALAIACTAVVLPALASGCAERQPLSAARFFPDASERALAEAAARGDSAEVAARARDGADVNAVGREGMTPLVWALGNKSKAGTRALLAAGANPNCREPKGGSAMWLAAGADDPEYLAILLEHRGNPNLANEDGESLIYTPIMTLKWPNLRLLVERGADVNARGIDTGTPLIRLATLNQFEQVAWRLERGADWRIADASGTTLADITAERRLDPSMPGHRWQQRVLAMLRERGAAVSLARP